jgi:hypothetical protein
LAAAFTFCGVARDRSIDLRARQIWRLANCDLYEIIELDRENGLRFRTVTVVARLGSYGMRSNRSTEDRGKQRSSHGGFLSSHRADR